MYCNIPDTPKATKPFPNIVFNASKLNLSSTIPLKHNPKNHIIAENLVNPRVSKLAKELEFELVNTVADLVKKNPEIVMHVTCGKHVTGTKKR